MQTVKKYAKLTRTPIRTVRHWCATGKLKAQKVGRDWVIGAGQSLKTRSFGVGKGGKP